MKRQSGENKIVSQHAKFVPVMLLTKPIYQKSPIARSKNSSEITQVPALKIQGGTNAPQTLSRPSTKSIATKSAAATKMVAKDEGFKRGWQPLADGITAPPPNLPPADQYK